MVSFRSSLESFAFKYKEEIRSNPLFRAQFHRMCQSAGVDPLACHKGFWASLLGLGDFYYELSVQVVDVCRASREKNGGLIEMQEVLSILKAKYKHQQNITVSEEPDTWDCRSASRMAAHPVCVSVPVAQ